MKIKFLISIFALSSSLTIFAIDSDDINYQDENGYTALHRAILNVRKEVAKDLIDVGANVNIQDNTGSTPLMIATSLDQPEIIQKLIDAGADVNLKCNGDITALIIAASYENPYIISQLVFAGARLEDKDDTGATALIIAASNPKSNTDTRIVDQLISLGADPNVEDIYNNNPLSIAITNQRWTLLNKLLSAGADPNLVDISELIKARNYSHRIKRFLEFKENLIDSNTFNRLHYSNELQDLTLKKIYLHYLNGEKVALKELFTTPGIGKKFQNYFIPEFVKNVLEIK